MQQEKTTDAILLGSGMCGNAIKCNDIVIKRYFDDCFINRIYGDVFDKLKTIDNNCFIKLIDKKMTEIHGVDKVKEYTYKYITKLNELMIDLPMEYTYETLHQYQLILNKLNKLKISIFDANENNAIISSNGLTIIDPDLYSIDKSEYTKGLIDHNKEYITLYISELWREEFILKHGEKYRKQLYFDINPFEKLFKCNNDNIDYNLKERFNAKTPDELLYKLVKKNSR